MGKISDFGDGCFRGPMDLGWMVWGEMEND